MGAVWHTLPHSALLLDSRSIKDEQIKTREKSLFYHKTG